MSSSRPRNASQRLLNLRSYGLTSPGWLVGRHLFLLAVLRYNDQPAENVSGLSKCQVIGHSLEVTAGFGLLHVDCLEEESSSFHVHSHGSHFPMACCNFCLPDLKMASLVQESQQTASKFDVLRETTIDRGQPFLFAVDPHFAFHVMKNTGLQRRRLKIRVWPEAQLYQVSLTTRVVEHKCVRQHLEQSSSWFCLGVSRPLQFSLLSWIAHQLLNTLALFLQLFRGEGVVVNSHESAESTVFCLNDSLDLFLAFFFFFLPVRPLGMVLILEFQFVDDHPPCQLIGRQYLAAGSRLGKCRRSEQNDGHHNGGGAVYHSHCQCAAYFQPVMHVTTSVTETDGANDQ